MVYASGLPIPTPQYLHLSRSWPRSEQENSPAATRRLFSFQAGALAGGQIVSQAAKRSADGELLLATRNRLSSVVPLSPDAWQMLSAPLRQPGIVALREYLRQRPPPAYGLLIRSITYLFCGR